MKRNNNIRTLEELQNEVHRLKADYKHRGVMLNQDAKTYIKQFTLGGLIKKYATPSGLLKLDENTNITSKIMSVALPMLLNSTLFRGSGLITKALGALVSGKVGKSLDAENLSGIFNIAKSFFSGKKKKEKEVAFVDYGIPPDSETY
ncbi:hypothetical protein GM921_11745 [Pedobacter sp. LMG 31464]|uniref:Uncharacterized protein n=1 Tax=Pedobacter planticolens TaxID=2679964 RepID=A0A923DY20_9SPHI|nr:hypothetical protein [Pedobacter planticolens]MBB2146162.1 hypothetical protein [Pedobacter planticolens]